MTGTAKTEEDEFRKIYALDVVAVPTNKPMIRQDHAGHHLQVPGGQTARHRPRDPDASPRQQPVLVGTRSVEMSERVSDRLRYDRLEMLALTDLLRDKLDSAKGLDKAKYAEWSALLNQQAGRALTSRRANAAMTPGQIDGDRPPLRSADHA